MTAAELPDPAPMVVRSLDRHSVGAHCPNCEKTVNLAGALYWAAEHSEHTGHRVIVDYQARYVIHRTKKQVAA